MKFKLDRIISIATLVALVIAIVLLLKKPASVERPQPPAVIVERAPSSDQRSATAEPVTQQPQWSGSPAAPQPAPSQATAAAASSPAAPSPKADTHANNSDEISAAVAQLMGSAAGTSGLSPSSNVGSGAPNIKDQQVSYDGDVVHGRFLTEIAGKDVWVTISGRMGQKDGYATFDPTEFKVGDLEVPVSLVNPALQKKLAEERDRLKVPNN